MSVVEGRADIKDLLLESTSTGTRRVVRPSGWGVVNSLARRGRGPVVLIHTQKFLNSIRKAHLCELRHFDLSSVSIFGSHLTCGFNVRCWVGKRTWRLRAPTSEFDPRRTLRVMSTRPLVSRLRRNKMPRKLDTDLLA